MFLAITPAAALVVRAWVLKPGELCEAAPGWRMQTCEGRIKEISQSMAGFREQDRGGKLRGRGPERLKGWDSPCPSLTLMYSSESEQADRPAAVAEGEDVLFILGTTTYLRVTRGPGKI